MKKGLLIFAGAAAFLLAGCTGTKTITTELDPETGRPVKITECGESIAKTVMDSTKGKIVLISKQGWLGGIRAVPAGSSIDAPAGCLEMVVGKDDTLLLTVPAANVESAAVANAVGQFTQLVAASRAGDLTIGATGVSAKTVSEK